MTRSGRSKRRLFVVLGAALAACAATLRRWASGVRRLRPPVLW